jgi:hypothetical protein
MQWLILLHGNYCSNWALLHISVQPELIIYLCGLWYSSDSFGLYLWHFDFLIMYLFCCRHSSGVSLGQVGGNQATRTRIYICFMFFFSWFLCREDFNICEMYASSYYDNIILTLDWSHRICLTTLLSCSLSHLCTYSHPRPET